eukprot:scaffold93829_cov19-Tisochrysis_lutea.AAC.2
MQCVRPGKQLPQVLCWQAGCPGLGLDHTIAQAHISCAICQRATCKPDHHHSLENHLPFIHSLTIHSFTIHSFTYHSFTHTHARNPSLDTHQLVPHAGLKWVCAAASK